MHELVRERGSVDVLGVMNSTSVSQLELRGMMAGDDAHTEKLTPTNGTDEASAVRIEAREEHRGGNGSRENATRKSRASRNVVEVGAVETLLNFAEAARVLGISLRQFRRLVDGGRVAFVKVSERTPRIRPSELQRFLEASAVKYSEVQS